MRKQEISFLNTVLCLLAYSNTRGLMGISFLEDVHTLYVFFAILAFYWLGFHGAEPLERR